MNARESNRLRQQEIDRAGRAAEYKQWTAVLSDPGAGTYDMSIAQKAIDFLERSFLNEFS
jgi:hypothetical protein